MIDASQCRLHRTDTRKHYDADAAIRQQTRKACARIAISQIDVYQCHVRLGAVGNFQSFIQRAGRTHRRMARIIDHLLKIKRNEGIVFAKQNGFHDQHAPCRIDQSGNASAYDWFPRFFASASGKGHKNAAGMSAFEMAVMTEKRIVFDDAQPHCFAKVAFAVLPPAALLPASPHELTEAETRGVQARGFLARRAFARATIAQHGSLLADGIDIRIAQSGALVLAAPQGLHLSLAGREDFCAVALSSRPVGIDIEPVVPAVPVLTMLHSAEIQAVEQAADVSSAFLIRWCAKEAWFKARATGFDREPSSLEIIMDDAGSQRFRVMDHDNNCIAGQGEVLNIVLAKRAFIAAVVTLAA